MHIGTKNVLNKLVVTPVLCCVMLLIRNITKERIELREQCYAVPDFSNFCFLNNSRYGTHRAG